MEYIFAINKEFEETIGKDIYRENEYDNTKVLHDIEMSTLSNFSIIKNLIIGEGYILSKPKSKGIFRNKTYTFQYKDYNFKYKKFSNFVFSLKEKRKLGSVKRYGNCHSASGSIAYHYDFDILTGYVTVGDKDILHSVLETKDDKSKIIDYTKNLVIDKADYIKLTNFREIQRISHEDYVNDVSLIYSLSPNFSIRAYLVFRDELMKELNKKVKVLRKED